RVAGQRVGGGQGVDDEPRSEPRFCPLRGIQLSGIQQLVHHLAAQQVLLGQQVVERVVGERGIDEPLVGVRGRHRTGLVAADRTGSCCAYGCSQADRQSAAGGGRPSRVLGQCPARSNQCAQERHRVGANQRVFGNAKTVES